MHFYQDKMIAAPSRRPVYLSYDSPIARLVQKYPIKSRSVIAHIRQANRGNVALENTHPFTR